MTKLIVVALASVVFSQLQGCAAAVVGGAAVGTSVALDRRTTGVYVSDQEIELKRDGAFEQGLSAENQQHLGHQL